MSATVTLTASNTTLAEGDVVDFTATITQAAASSPGKQLLVWLDGPFRVDGLPRLENQGKLELLAVYPSAAAACWITRFGTDGPEIVPLEERGGAWQLSYATERESSPLALRFGAGVTIGSPWTIRWRCRVLPGASGRTQVSCRVVESDDSLLYAGAGSVSTADLTLTRFVRVATLTPPTGVSATGGATSVALAWTNAGVNLSAHQIWRSLIGEFGPWERATLVPPGATSWTDSGLLAGTAYYYRIQPVGPAGSGAHSSTVDATTSAAGSVPSGAGTTLGAAGKGSNTALLTWAAGTAAGHTKWSVERATSSGGTFGVVGTVGAATLVFTDRNVEAGMAYWYKVRPTNAAGNGTYTAEASVTMPRLPQTRSGPAGITSDPGGRFSIVNAGGASLIFSDRDRPISRRTGRWDYAGLRPPLNAPALSANSGGLMTGDFSAYIVYLRANGSVRSLRSPASASIGEVTGKQLVIAPDWDAEEGRIVIRDEGSDDFGNSILGVDFYEVYLTEIGIGNAWRIGRYPLTQQTVAVSSTLTLEDLSDGTRRPLEREGQTTLLPACAFAARRGERIFLCGQTSHGPEAEGANLVLTAASRTVTSDDFDFNESMLFKRLFVNGKDTGWELTDVVSFTSARISHSDAAVNAAGWNQATVTAYDFAFIPHRNRVYATAFYNGEQGGFTTVSPETQEPLVTLETELEPDDAEDFSGIIAARDALFIVKPSRVFCMVGGKQPGAGENGFAEDYQVFAVSRTRGVLSHHSLCVDPDDNVWGLSASGPVQIRQSGVAPVGRFAGAARMFEDVFEIEGAQRSVGAFFAREDAYVVVGLDAKGERGGRSGLWLDKQTMLMTRFELPRRVTALFEYADDCGDKVLGFADEGGNYGELFPRGMARDDHDLTRSNPAEVEIAYECAVTLRELTAPPSLEVPDGRGRLVTMSGMGEVDVVRVQPSIRVHDSADPGAVTVEVCNRPRMGVYGAFEAAEGKSVTFDTDTEAPHQELECNPSQLQQIRVTMTPPRDGRLEASALDGVFLIHGMAAEQGA